MIESLSIADTATYGLKPQVLDRLTRFNFLFGTNGVGKTTITKVIANPGAHLHCNVAWKKGTPLEPMVYNRDFIERNFNAAPRLKGIFTLGQQDIANKVFRHVTDAFREDPVRILRVARFAARFTDFTVAPETMQLMREMVAHGEVDHLVAERVWQELARGLMEEKPSRMFEVLRECGALQVLLPEVARLWGVPQRAEYHPEVDTGVHLMMVLDMAARLQAPLPVRFACLVHDLGKGTTAADMLPRHIGHEERSAELLKDVAERLRVPVDCRETADVVAREHGHIHRSGDLSAAALVRLLERCDAIRKPERFADILLACECDARGRLGFEESAYPQRQRLAAVLAAVQSVVTRDIAAQAAAKGVAGPQVGALIHQARVEAVAQWLQPRSDVA